MLATTPPRRHARCLRWQTPPWDDHHPDWLRLDRDLPAEHRVRLIDRVVDTLDLRPYLHDFCKGFGTASWHPALLLKIALYELDRKVHSPAQWFSDCREHTPLMWLTRGAKPSRAALYDARRRLCPELLEQLNAQVLHAAHGEGLCPGQRASLDGTFLAGKGSRHHLLNTQRLDRRLELLRQAVASDEAASPLTRRPSWMARTPEGRVKQHARYHKARKRLEAKLAKHAKQQTRRAKARRQPAERVVICVSEPEAAIGPDKMGAIRPLYDAQVLRDLDSPFLLGYGMYATCTDAGLLPDMLARSKRLTGRLPEKLLGDTIYASVADLQACRAAKVTLYAPVKKAAAKAAAPAASSQRQTLPLVAAVVAVAVVAAVAAEAAQTQASGQGGGEGQPPPQGRPKLYGKEQFRWDEQTHSYTCPAGQRLYQVGQGRAERVSGEVNVEKYATVACKGCAQRQQCTTAKRGRQIKRMADEPLVEELRQRMASEEGKQLYKLRKQTVELAFADTKQHRGLRQLSGYGLQQAEAQLGLVVLLNNGKALLHLRQAATKAA
jgi:transposase